MKPSTELEGLDPEACGAVLASDLWEAGYDGGGILLALDSLDCLAVSATVDPSVRSGGRRAVTYELEHYLPLPSEQFTADYLERSDSLFAVVVETAAFRPLLQSLENTGVFVQSVVPTALIRAQFSLEDVHTAESKNGQSDYALLWRDDGRLECVLHHRSEVTAWYVVNQEADSLGRMLRAHVWRTDRPIVIRAYEENLLSAHDLGESSGISMEDVNRTMANATDVDAEDRLFIAVSRGAEAILSGKIRPWIDLCRDDLGVGDFCRPIRRSLRFALVGAIVLGLALSAAFWMRHWQYDAVANDFQKQQAEVFHKTLPDQKVQTGFRGRLASECKRLSGLKGNEADLPRRMSSLRSLYHALASMPAKLRFQLLEMRFEQDQVSLDGQVRAHGDADTIASSLRKEGFSVEAPSTRVLSDQGVAVHMTARWSNQP